ncbi:MAG: DUF1552 domain-containing protein [Fuerstiella sp.]|nr:DUF1552 domain-containing protein [Fuerstiella sp.]
MTLIITDRHLSRRKLLQGTGAAIALPMLNAMQPAIASAAINPPIHRIAVVYVPNGIVMKHWTPNQTGTEFPFPRILKSLQPFRDQITVISGLENTAPTKVRGGGHAKASGSFLSGMPPKFTAGADVRAGITFDQVAAGKWASETRVPSLQLGLEDSRMVGNCDSGSSCAYTNSISWKDAETPMPVDVNPRSVFERLFGTVDPGLSAEDRARRLLYRRSILDVTRESTRELFNRLGADDQRRMDEYLTSIREVEKRISDAEKRELIPGINKPSGIPFEFPDYARMMLDLQVIAFQSDLTRVSSIMFGREGSVRTYPEIGVADPHHPLTHHRGHPDFIERVTKINCLHVELFAYFLERLKATQDGAGSLLDRSAILYGGGLSDGNTHSSTDLPLLVAGGLCGTGGRHIEVDRQPITNLFVDLLNRVDISTGSFGDSTGRLDTDS